MDRSSGYLVDIDGVLVVSWEPIDGAVEALQRLRDDQVPLRFATNTTSRTRRSVAAALTDAGMPVDPDEILTAPTATAAYLRHEHPGARCLLINDGDLSDDLDGIDVVTDGPADVVVLGGAGPAFSYVALNAAFRLLTDGAPLVVMHRNLAWMTSQGLSLDTGGFVAGLEEAAGVEAQVVGKPSRAFFDAGVASLGLAHSEVAMIGDDLVNDVLGAQAAGLTGILVRTGKFDQRVVDEADTAPDHVVDSFADIAALWD
jgi:HAD superfamily hydrolase (TIGR01458 family)